jgi:transcriptional regulator GlxA family with amidase domain
VRIHELAVEVDWSDRHLTRRFGAAVGISPKRYADLMRVHSALHALLVQGDDASTVACDAGYADQSHFVRAVRRYTGLSPSRLPADLALPTLPLALR